MKLISSHKINKFGGVDNVNQLLHLQESTKDLGRIHYLLSAENVDLDDERRITRRDGYRTVLSMGNDLHSLWSDGENCFFISGTTLYR